MVYPYGAGVVRSESWDKIRTSAKNWVQCHIPFLVEGVLSCMDRSQCYLRQFHGNYILVHNVQASLIAPSLGFCDAKTCRVKYAIPNDIVTPITSFVFIWFCPSIK